MRALYRSLLGLCVANTCVLGAQAQEEAPPAPAAPARPARVHYLRAFLGTTSTLGWEYPCARVGLEYAPMLGQHIGVAGRLVGVGGYPTASSALYGPWITQIPDQRYRASFAEVEALYYPLGLTRRLRLAVGAGCYAGFYRQHSIRSASIVSNQVVAYELATYQGNRTGYVASLNVEVALGQQRAWLLGLKLMRQQGLGGIDNLPSQGLTLARRL